VTPIYGNDYFLFRSPIFWFGILITVILALAPRYLYQAWTFGFHPTDLDILNWNYKVRPNMDIIREAILYREPEKDESSPLPEPTTPHSMRSTGPPRRQSMQVDMSTGVRSQSRGYSFAQEDGGVAMRRMQSNLSGALPATESTVGGRKPRGSNLLRSIRYPLRRKQPPGDQQS
jgi:phospholipid-translocating ATPase